MCPTLLECKSRDIISGVYNSDWHMVGSGNFSWLSLMNKLWRQGQHVEKVAFRTFQIANL